MHPRGGPGVPGRSLPRTPCPLAQAATSLAPRLIFIPAHRQPIPLPYPLKRQVIITEVARWPFPAESAVVICHHAGFGIFRLESRTMVVTGTRGAKLRRPNASRVAGMKGSCSPAYFLRKLVLPGASKVGA